MRAAVALVQKAAAGKRSVLIHGDYDVDGISGTALVYRYLDGVIDRVHRFLPNRRTDGYGLSKRAVDWAASEGVGLVIAVDCGSSDAELISSLESDAIDVIVCDHHELPPDGKTAGVMLNPNRPGENYPFKSLCGTGVAFKLIQALHASGIRGKRRPDELLDLMALATVGDMSPLVGENRYFVRAGLSLMNRSPRPGLEAIKSYSRIGAGEITSEHISYVFAPRLNAPGRVSKARPSLEILCADGREQALQLASVLEGENDRRKELTRLVQDDVARRIRGMPDRDDRGAFVLASDDWDEGVLGIAAARVVEEFGRPTVLMNIRGDVAKGSGRSVPGVNLKAHLDRLQDRFVRYGGHSQAVGLTLGADGFEGFARVLSENVKGELGTRGAFAPLEVDSALELDECSMDLLAFFSKCQPFGLGNREPVWRISDLQVTRDTCFVGSGHLKLYFQDSRGNPGEAIAFNWDRPETPDDLHNRVVDVAVNVKEGQYMNRTYPELRLVDIRFHRG